MADSAEQSPVAEVADWGLSVACESEPKTSQNGHLCSSREGQVISWQKGPSWETL